MAEHYPFTLTPLPYSYDALAPYLDAKTLEIHHDKHQAGYVKNLNKVLDSTPALQGMSLEQLLTYNGALPASVRTAIMRNAGGVYAHELYFDGMTPPHRSPLPAGALATEIDRCFTTFAGFRDAFTQIALAQFGSGWTWLTRKSNGDLMILPTDNQDTPLPRGLQPILAVDVWEHAYYLHYQSRRADYLAAWWNLVDWKFAGENFNAIAKNT